jgi:predicted ribosomally synthesized six-cysteine peptide SCIFF
VEGELSSEFLNLVADAVFFTRKNFQNPQKILTRHLFCGKIDDVKSYFVYMEEFTMKRIMTIETKNIAKTTENGGCGECQTSCQSACKTSCGVANQQCENKNNK